LIDGRFRVFRFLTRKKACQYGVTSSAGREYCIDLIESYDCLEYLDARGSYQASL
jgi:hypothetical protein